MTDNTCENCIHFWPIKIPTGKGHSKETNQAHCLAQTIYAKNKPGNPVYPPKAKTADLPYAKHHVVIVRREQSASDCQYFTKKGVSK